MPKPFLHSDESLEKKAKETKYRDILECESFSRLQKISFLGAVDPWLKEKDFKTNFLSNRYNHSIGVFSVASKIIELDDDFPEGEIDLFLASCLLHDVGHGPLSHSVEGYFEKIFGINHHINTNFKISSHKFDLRSLIASLGLHHSDITGVLDGNIKGYFTKYFTGPFNVDTLDGIYRCYGLFDKAPVYSLDTTIRSLLLEFDQRRNEAVLDGFWQMKADVYNRILYNGYGRIADEIANEVVEENGLSLSAQDFERTDRSFYTMFPELKFKIVDGVERAISGQYIYHMKRSRLRYFEVRKKCRLSSEQNIAYRYVQKKGPWFDVNRDLDQGSSSEDCQYGLFDE